MARIMGKAGHRIIIVDRGPNIMTMLTGFSKYVNKFYLIPPTQIYEEQLMNIWQDERVDWFLPMNLSLDDIKFNIVMDFAALQNSVKFSTLSINNIFLAETLQNQQEFLKKCQEIGLPTI